MCNRNTENRKKRERNRINTGINNDLEFTQINSDIKPQIEESQRTLNRIKAQNKQIKK